MRSEEEYAARQELIDEIEAQVGTMRSMPWEQVSDADLAKLAEWIREAAKQ